MVADLGRNIFKLFQVQCCRFYSVLYAVHSMTEPSTYCACRIHAVDFISVALGDRYSKFMLMIVGVISYLLLA